MICRFVSGKIAGRAVFRKIYQSARQAGSLRYVSQASSLPCKQNPLKISCLRLNNIRAYSRDSWEKLPVNSHLKHLLEEYAALECGVQELVSAQCREVCELCTACCCRADLCEEALESPFLCAVHGKDELDSDRYGFLTETGCALETGRPPVCYEFFCDELQAAQPDELHRSVLLILGRLPAYAGEKAHGDAHLAEIMQVEELDHLAFQRLEKQMRNAREALDCIRAFYNDGTLPEHSRKVLSRITASTEN